MTLDIQRCCLLRFIPMRSFCASNRWAALLTFLVATVSLSRRHFVFGVLLHVLT
jgi:hypothetical protein